MRVICVGAARPNFMKVKPVIDALEHRGVETVLVHTGQHYDSAMSDVFFEELGLRRPDHHLGTGSGTHAEQTARVMIAFEQLVSEIGGDVVAVFGDVNSTLACSIVAAKAGLRVVHVEAGLRSRDWTMPEEINRVVTDRVSDVLFCPSPDAVENLRAEGFRDDQVHLVGNVMIDTLFANIDRARERGVLQRLQLDGAPFGLVTLHRPSNVDDSAIMGELVRALNAISTDVPLVFPVHPRTRPKLSAHTVSDRVHVIEPLGYLDFVGLLASAALVLTDSGGVQEETTALGIPCLTLRENTERPITITEGTNELVGQRADDIIRAARRALGGHVAWRCPVLWDGKAGERIADVIAAIDPDMPRPTER
jgi:UDP-N-acetylglucosamine 2-epimerase (non-hydrolysing)